MLAQSAHLPRRAHAGIFISLDKPAYRPNLKKDDARRIHSRAGDRAAGRAGGPGRGRGQGAAESLLGRSRRVALVERCRGRASVSPECADADPERDLRGAERRRLSFRRRTAPGCSFATRTSPRWPSTGMSRWFRCWRISASTATTSPRRWPMRPAACWSARCATGRPNGAGLYRLETDGTLAKVLGGTGQSAGLGWNEKGDALYWTCGTTRTIWRFRYDARRGTVSNRQVFHECPPEEGAPDRTSRSMRRGRSGRRGAKSGVILKIGGDRRLRGQVTFPSRRHHVADFRREGPPHGFRRGDHGGGRLEDFRVPIARWRACRCTGRRSSGARATPT